MCRFRRRDPVDELAPRWWPSRDGPCARGGAAWAPWRHALLHGRATHRHGERRVDDVQGGGDCRWYQATRGIRTRGVVPNSTDSRLDGWPGTPPERSEVAWLAPAWRL